MIPITEEGHLKTHVVHFGNVFRDDNKRVWNILKSLLHKSAAYNHVVGLDQTTNGRKAWLTLKQFYEGEDYLQRLQDEGFAILSNTVYRGESKHYNYESYVERHVKAHKLLVDAKYGPEEGGMDDSTKIQYFKAGIKVDAGLEQSISSARTQGKQRGAFEAYVSYLGADMNSKNDRKRKLKTSYKVAGIEHESRKSGSHQNGKMVDGKRVEAKRYSKEEWSQLNRNQKRAVIRLNYQKRNKNKDKNKPAKDQKGFDIKALQSSIQDDLVALGDAIVARLSAARDITDPERENTTAESNTKNSKRVAQRSQGMLFGVERRHESKVSSKY